MFANGGFWFQKHEENSSTKLVPIAPTCEEINPKKENHE
jgi:hypothetical protein